MIKRHRDVQRRTKKGICRLPLIKVYRDEVRTSKRCTFFMSNLERMHIFICFFVNSFLSGSPVKKLVV